MMLLLLLEALLSPMCWQATSFFVCWPVILLIQYDLTLHLLRFLVSLSVLHQKHGCDLVLEANYQVPLSPSGFKVVCIFWQSSYICRNNKQAQRC